MWTMVNISSFLVQASWGLPKLHVLYCAASLYYTSSVPPIREPQHEQPSFPLCYFKPLQDAYKLMDEHKSQARTTEPCEFRKRYGQRVAEPGFEPPQSLLTTLERGQETGAARVLLSITSTAGADEQQGVRAEFHPKIQRFGPTKCFFTLLAVRPDNK
ncbi:Hypothetical predicted protein [Scomber scombrus]|uniref:Uncharacterized protein n=1 Tax=Scomber scombrus TaxID=13677 RepID=A0AAV1P5Y7_SCOSC